MSLNMDKNFTYYGGVISNDVTVNNDFDIYLSKANSSFGTLSKRVGRIICSGSQTVYRFTEGLASLPFYTEQGPEFYMWNR